MPRPVCESESSTRRRASSRTSKRELSEEERETLWSVSYTHLDVYKRQFHERATALRALAKYLNEHKEDIYVDYGTTGGTVADMRVDVDGGIAVLFAYSSMARKELPNDTVLAEGRPIGLGEANLAQTFYTSPHGVGLHINAYNFPCWGILEKLATSIIAGVPVIVKPATASAHVAERVVRGIVESGTPVSYTHLDVYKRQTDPRRGRAGGGPSAWCCRGRRP